MFFQYLFSNPLFFVGAVLIVALSISFHEFFHALIAWTQGDDTAKRLGRLTLNPLAHMEPGAWIMLILVGVAWGSTPVSMGRLRFWFSNALVSFSGPFANLLLVAAAIIMMPHAPESWQVWLGLIAQLNALLFLLNLLPIPPLDGFGILETFVPALRPLGHSLSAYGLLILMVLFFLLGFGDMLYGAARHLVDAMSGLLLHTL